MHTVKTNEVETVYKRVLVRSGKGEEKRDSLLTSIWETRPSAPQQLQVSGPWPDDDDDLLKSTPVFRPPAREVPAALA